MSQIKIALQMYSVRDAVSGGEDLIAALKTVKELGYQGVEFAGFFGLEAETLRAALEEIGLTALSSHEGIDALERNIDALIDYSARLGCPFLACSYAPAHTPEEVERARRVLREAREKAAAHGIEILYHNHTHEFDPVEGTLPIDVIRKACRLEPDLYWVHQSGRDPARFVRENAADIGLVHLKDGNAQGVPCAIGEGVCNIGEILGAVQDMGAEWIVVENDDPVPDGISDARRSRLCLSERFHL